MANAGTFKPGPDDRRGKGGERENAGRKPDTVKAMRAELAADWPALVAKMRDLTDSTDESIKLKAVQWCMEAIIGKNHEHVTIDNNLSIDVRAKLDVFAVKRVQALLLEEGNGG